MANLTTTSRAKQNPALENMDDVTLSALLEASSDIIEQELHRKLTSEARTEYYNGDGLDWLHLKQYPVTTLTSVTLIASDGTETARLILDDQVDLLDDTGTAADT